MRVAVLANRHDDDAGHVGDRLRHHGGWLDVVHRDEPEQLAERVGSPDVLLVLGSDWSVHDPTRARAVRAEAEVLRRALRRGTPVLAICYGAQLAAAALGCRVTPAERPEIGWRTIETDDDQLVPSGPWFQLHADRWWDEGPVASLARSDDAPQAFRLGRLLAVQFHPEVTSATAGRWLRESDAVTAAGVDQEAIERELRGFGDAGTERAERLVDTFMAASADAPFSAMGGGSRR
jgi:GMP synthase-like glutamine amidotransferase